MAVIRGLFDSSVVRLAIWPLMLSVQTLASSARVMDARQSQERQQEVNSFAARASSMAGKSSSVTGHYLRLIGDRPVLTREQEIAAWERGDTELLVRSQLPYVIRIAAKISTGYGFEDIEAAISAGNLGLLLSLRSYDARLSRLSTYATRAIRWSILNEISRETRGIGPSRTVQTATGHHRPESISGRERMLSASYYDVVDLDLPDQIQMLKKAMETLDDRTKRILEGTLQGDTKAEIGRSMNLSRERVRQIEAKAIAKLRLFFKERSHAALCSQRVGSQWSA